MGRAVDRIGDPVNRRARVIPRIIVASACTAAGMFQLAASGVGVVAAQPLFQAPEIVWETAGRTSAPQIVVDAAGRAHLFFIDTSEDGTEVTLYHVDLDSGAPYSPNDVLVGLSPDYRDYRLAADPFGNVHLVFKRQGALWHTLAPGSDAGDAGNWSAPITLGNVGPGADLAIDQKGRLHVCFPTGSEVHHMWSEDAGVSWSQDQLVSAMNFPSIPVYLACAVDADGVIHVAWSEAAPPSYYPSLATWYTRSDDDGDIWDELERVAGEHFTLPELLADTAGNVHLLWQADIGLGGRNYRQRPAGQGRSWSAVETVVPEGLGGMSGDAPLAVDGDGNVHVVTSAPEPVWVGRGPGGWGPMVPLATALAGELNTSGSVEYPAFGIANGNSAHIAFAFDSKRIYYISGLLGAAEVRTVPMPLPEAMASRLESESALDGSSAALATNTATADSTAETHAATAEASSSPDPMGAFSSNDGGLGWLRWIGPAMALALVAGVVWRHLARR